MMAKVTVVQKQGEEEVPAAIIAQSIRKIANATEAIYRSGLNEKAIILLISEASGVGRREVKFVLYNMLHLKSEYLAPHKPVKS
jgi:Ser/Thr protein kinase RdoA (MazF antagonist)